MIESLITYASSISHTNGDKPLVGPITLRLAKVFDQDSVFYDSWSIHPGDGIVNKMNDAMSKFIPMYVAARKRVITNAARWSEIDIFFFFGCSST